MARSFEVKIPVESRPPVPGPRPVTVRYAPVFGKCNLTLSADFFFVNIGLVVVSYCPSRGKKPLLPVLLRINYLQGRLVHRFVESEFYIKQEFKS